MKPLFKTKLREIFTGYPRPRTIAFHKALSTLFETGRLIVEGYPQPSITRRIATNASAFFNGFRSITVKGSIPCIIHQATTKDRQCPYIMELDVPMGIFGYSFSRRKKFGASARKILEEDHLRAIVVFSEWAKRSFRLHFGDTVASKCRVLYPLSTHSIASIDPAPRKHDFIFISTQFRIKAGVEVVRAFARLRKHGHPSCTMCVITNLNEAMNALGPLGQFQGIQWLQATMSTNEISELLSRSYCLVHPSLFDSFGVVVLEAIAAGCVVIGSRIASFPELVTHGSNGFLVDLPIAAVVYDDFIHPYSRAEAFSTYLDSLNLISLEEQIYSYMKDVLADEVRRRRMMALSLGHFNSKFAPDIWIREMCTLLAYAFPDCFYNEPSPKARLVQGSTSE